MRLSLPKFIVAIAAAAALSVAAAACGSTTSDSTSSTVAAADCTPDKMQTQTAGELTVATDKPAYPPYFENDDPTNGKGFESATAYAIANQLGTPPKRLATILHKLEAEGWVTVKNDFVYPTVAALCWQNPNLSEKAAGKIIRSLK